MGFWIRVEALRVWARSFGSMGLEGLGVWDAGIDEAWGKGFADCGFTLGLSILRFTVEGRVWG